MNDTESLLVRLDRSARSVARLSAATKAISGVILVIAVVMFMYALSQADRRTEDFVGFGLLSVGIAAFALVFASIAAFHAAFSDAMRIAAAVHLNIEHLARSQERQPRRTAAEGAPAAPLPAAPLPAPLPAAPSSAPLPDAPPPAPLPEAPPPAEAAAAKVAPPAVKTPEQPAMKACPACGKAIRADALRCRHCFERV